MTDKHTPDNVTTTYPEGWAFPELSRKELELFTLRRNQQVKELLEVLEYVLNSDVAMREEDEGRISPVLNRIREVIKATKGEST